MNGIALIAVPYEVSRLREGMGRGPDQLLASGAAEALGAAGAIVDTEVVELTGGGSVRQLLLRGAGRHGRHGRERARRRLVRRPRRLQHAGDTTFGYFDGMGLAVLTGSAWQGMLRTVPGAKPLPESAIVLAGARDFDDDEARRLRDSEIKHLPAERIVSDDALDGAMAAVEP